MKVLIVANHNPGSFSPFVVEQARFLGSLGIEIDYYGIHGKGPLGYLKNLPKLRAKIAEWKPDLVHAHYGLSGLLATLQRMAPTVVTYHGSDIHSLGWALRLSRLAMRLAAFNIFVSEDLRKIANYCGSNSAVISCGVDTSVFFPIDRTDARLGLGWDPDRRYVLFAGAFSRAVKNAPLAKEAVSLVGGGAELVELSGCSREQVNLMMNASDCLLVTSLNESGPLVVKEAMASNTPIVSVNVGDVASVTSGSNCCLFAGYDAGDIAQKLRQTFNSSQRPNGRDRILDLGLSNLLVAERVKKVYEEVLAMANR